MLHIRPRTSLIAAALVVAATRPLQSQPAPAPAPSPDALQCQALAALDLQRLRDAPTRITAARLVDVPAPPANANPRGGAALLHASPIRQYCQVLGYVAPQNKFELRLPLPSQWNEKFFFVPCAGFCGAVNGNACNTALARGYAAVTNNGGHDGAAGFDGTWAANAPDLQVDLGWRSVRVVTLAAKEIITRYYARPIQRSYISSCSKGGQAVLMAVQRFPRDFDGAIAGAPVHNLTGQVLASSWFAQAVHDGSGKSLIDSATAAAIHRSILERCGSQSGIAEPFVAEPLACDWRPAMLACTAANGASCLTEQQVAAIAKVMQRPRTSSGRVLYGAQLPGAETDWAFWFFADSARNVATTGHFLVAQQFNSFLAHAAARDVDPLKMSIDAMSVSLARARSIYDATSPDLSAFKARGGKLILWHGLADGGVPAGTSIDYYERVSQTMGGRQAIHDFLRLFLIPGMHHCAGGPGPNYFDSITALENWVERGVAPEELITRPFAMNAPERTRPVYPYPAVARYSGSGDPMQASSWVMVRP